MIGKLNYKRLLLLAALPAFMLASCSQEETPGEPGSNPDAQNGEIRFEIGFAPQNEAMQTDAQTRVATDTDFNSTWEEGDAIGIYAVKHGEQLAASGNYIHNVKLTYTDGKWTAEEAIYWPQNGTKLDFYAYHPYDDAPTDPTSIAFNVHTDQSATTGGKSNYNLSDLLMAKNDNLGKGYGKGETVKLSFTHALAMVQVNVSKSMVGDYPADMLKVWLNGCTTYGILNLSTQSTIPPTGGSPSKIRMYPCPNDGGDAPGIYAYRALVPVQTIAKGTALFSFEYDGSTLLRSEPLVESLSLAQSIAEKFDMTFPFTSATAHVSSNVRLDGLFAPDKLATITHLKVMGEMTAADFATIKDMMPAITSLDLSQATVVGNAIPKEALIYKKKLQKFSFPSGITAIGNAAFFSCEGLTGSLTIPEGVETIGDNAFYACDGFTGSLTIPKSVRTIGYQAFGKCWNFTGSLTIPEGVTMIGGDAFSECRNFTGSLIIPNSVTSIGMWAFLQCSNITSITCHIADPGKVGYGDDMFQDMTSVTAVYVPANAVDVYKAHAAWSIFAGIIKPIPAP